MNNESIPLFQEFTLDLARGCVMRASQPIHLRPQTYEVLKYLVEHRGRLIAKDTLIEEVWEGRAVTDGSLGKCIEEVRQALGPEGRSYVRNVRGRGYIFEALSKPEGAEIYPVASEQIDFVSVVIEEEEDLGELADVDGRLLTPIHERSRGLVGVDNCDSGARLQPRSGTSLLPAASHNRRWLAANTRGRLTLLFSVIVVVGAVLTLAYRYYSRSGVQRINSIAVLPFKNASEDPEMEYLSEGIGDSVTNSLSQLSDVRVMSRSSVDRYKSRSTDVVAAGRELGVQAVLTGRVAQVGDSFVFNVELVNASDNSHIWGEQYTRKLTNLASLQTEIARDISKKLWAQLSAPDERKLQKGHTADAEAYRLYLLGRYHKLKATESEIRKSIAHFQKALEVDPNYALAYAALADAYRTLPISGYVASSEAFPQAKAAAKRALELDEDLVEAHIVLGWVKFWFDWDWNGSENSFRRAIELSPNNADAHRGYAHLLSNQGRHEEALQQARRATELDPMALMTQSLESQFLFYAGREDEAIATLRGTIDLDPDFWIAHSVLGRVYTRRGMFSEAIIEFNLAKKLSNGSVEVLTQLGYALAKSGQVREALATVAELKNAAAEKYVPAYDFAMIYNGLNRKDEALGYLEKSLAEREVQLTFSKVDVRWDELRTDERFKRVMREVGLPQ